MKFNFILFFVCCRVESKKLANRAQRFEKEQPAKKRVMRSIFNLEREIKSNMGSLDDSCVTGTCQDLEKEYLRLTNVSLSKLKKKVIHFYIQLIEIYFL
jgi:hypothetical protein